MTPKEIEALAALIVEQVPDAKLSSWDYGWSAGIMREGHTPAIRLQTMERYEDGGGRMVYSVSIAKIPEIVEALRQAIPIVEYGA